MHILKCETGLTIGLAFLTSAHESNERLELTPQDLWPRFNLVQPARLTTSAVV